MPGWQAVGDVDGDGRRDRARLVYLGGYGPGNWELVVDMTTLGQQAVRFTGNPVLPGNIDAPTIAGSVDADGDGHADIFVKVSSGASTQFWTIFTLVGQQIGRSPSGAARTFRGQWNAHPPRRLPMHGAQFVTVSEGTELPGYIKWIYERDTYAWSGAELVLVSEQTGQLTNARPGTLLPRTAESAVAACPSTRRPTRHQLVSPDHSRG